MSRCEKPVVDHHDGDCTDQACHSDGHEVLFERQLQCDQAADQDRPEDRAEAPNTAGKAHAGRSHGGWVKPACIGVGKHCGAERGRADDEDDHEEQFGRLDVAHQGQRGGAERIEGGQHVLDVKLVAQPCAEHRADDGAQVEQQREGQRGTEAVACHRHQLGQPGAERVHHEQAGEEGNPDHHRAEAATVLEQLPMGASSALSSAGTTNCARLRPVVRHELA